MQAVKDRLQVSKLKNWNKYIQTFGIGNENEARNKMCDLMPVPIAIVSLWHFSHLYSFRWICLNLVAIEYMQTYRVETLCHRSACEREN